MIKGLLALGAFFLSTQVVADQAVRHVSKTSCELIRLNLGLRMTTQIIFEQKPETTVIADEAHFKIHTNKNLPRSLVIIPHVDASQIERFRASQNGDVDGKALAKWLDDSLSTNLLVVFKNQTQLSFQLRFVERNEADNIVNVTHVFDGGSCEI